MTRSKIRIHKDATPSKSQIHFSTELGVKGDESSFLLDWVAGCEVLRVRSAHAISAYEQEMILSDTRN